MHTFFLLLFKFKYIVRRRTWPKLTNQSVHRSTPYIHRPWHLPALGTSEFSVIRCHVWWVILTMKLSTCLDRKEIEFDVCSDASDRGCIFASDLRLDCVVACRTGSSACPPSTARGRMPRTISCEASDTVSFVYWDKCRTFPIFVSTAGKLSVV